MAIKLALDARAELGECPVWDDRRHKLFWVDIEGCAIHCFDPETGNDRQIDVGQRVGAIALCGDGGLVAAMAHGFYNVDFDVGLIAAIGDPEADKPNNRFNDGKCDPAGRFWAGTMGMSKPRQPVGGLYVLEAGQIRQALDGVSVSNGLAWSADKRTMYYIDTQLQTVDAFDYQLTIGALANRRSIIRLPEGTGRPDGMTIDAEGMLWVAHWGGWQVGRYDPATGRQLTRIDVPAEFVSSCAFGGLNLDTLFITTSRKGINSTDLEAQPSAGGVFCVKPGYLGLSAARYQPI